MSALTYDPFADRYGHEQNPITGAGTFLDPDAYLRERYRQYEYEQAQINAANQQQQEAGGVTETVIDNGQQTTVNDWFPDNVGVLPPESAAAEPNSFFPGLVQRGGSVATSTRQPGWNLFWPVAGLVLLWFLSKK